MKFVFLVIAILINFFNHSLISSKKRFIQERIKSKILLKKNQLMKIKLIKE